MKEVSVKDEIKEKNDKKGKEEENDAQMWKAVETCVRKKGKKGAHM